MASLLSKLLMKISQQLIFHSQLTVLLLQSKILVRSWSEEAAGTFRNLAMFNEQPLLFVFIVNGVLDRLKRLIEFIWTFVGLCKQGENKSGYLEGK